MAGGTERVLDAVDPHTTGVTSTLGSIDKTDIDFPGVSVVEEAVNIWCWSEHKVEEKLWSAHGDCL